MQTKLIRKPDHEAHLTVSGGICEGPVGGEDEVGEDMLEGGGGVCGPDARDLVLGELAEAEVDVGSSKRAATARMVVKRGMEVARVCSRV